MRLISIALPLAAAAMAAAPAGGGEQDYFVRMWNSAAAPDDGWIEIQGWDWEVESEASANKVDGFPVKQSVKPLGSGSEKWIRSRDGSSATRPPGTSDMTMKRGTSPTKPQAPGRVKVQFPWPACSKGQRLPSVELRDAHMLYVLEGVTVTDCSTGSATFAFANLRSSSAPPLPR